MWSKLPAVRGAPRRSLAASFSRSSLRHSTIHRWVIRFAPKLGETFNRRRNPAGGNWFVDETYIKVGKSWTYLYRAIDNAGNTVEFLYSDKRDKRTAKRFFKQAIQRNGRPECVTLDRYQANHAALVALDNEHRLKTERGTPLKPIAIETGRYKNNRIEQHHRRIKRRIKPMMGFKSKACAAIILGGIEMVQMMRHGQANYARNPSPNLKHQFEIIAKAA